MELSVIIPSYMPGTYINECLDSLCAQTIGHDAFEVIVVLNGPKEPYLHQIETHPILKSGISTKVVHTEKKGVSNARNMALDAAEGRYVCFIDDDDYVTPCYLEQLYAVAKGHEDCLVVSNVKGFDEERACTVDDYLGKAYEKCREVEDVTLMSARALLSSSCCKMIPQSIIAGRRFSTSFKIGEDALFVASISDRINGVRFTSPQAVYYRRLRAGSALRKRQSPLFFAWNACRLWGQYIRIYLSDVRNYSLPFFANRLMAVVKSHLRCAGLFPK